jgi:hypothetical protein
MKPHAVVTGPGVRLGAETVSGEQE